MAIPTSLIDLIISMLILISQDMLGQKVNISPFTVFWWSEKVRGVNHFMVNHSIVFHANLKKSYCSLRNLVHLYQGCFLRTEILTGVDKFLTGKESSFDYINKCNRGLNLKNLKFCYQVHRGTGILGVNH